MTFATVANIATMLFCLAVLVQSVRMMRSLKAVKEGALTEVVEALDKSTAQARVVLSELKMALGHCAGHARVLGEAKEMAEELGVMIGIANASAERLVEAASAANAARSSQDSAIDAQDPHDADAQVIA
jgi:mevalonate kinase